MPLSWNEIKDRALAFSREYVQETSEDGEAKTFWDDFFHIFGVTRRRVASFEAPVKKADGRGRFIDLLWRGVLLVEHKSRGKDLDRAMQQALDYFPGLKERDLPRYVLVSDFARFRLYDLDESQTHEFPLADLYQHMRLFGFIAGYQTRSFGQQDPVNITAAERLGRLHDGLKAAGYDGHPLEVLWFGCCSVCSPRTPRFSSVGSFRTMWSYARRKTALIWGHIWRNSFRFHLDRPHAGIFTHRFLDLALGLVNPGIADGLYWIARRSETRSGVYPDHRALVEPTRLTDL